jgi:hypothetical protein
VVEVGAGERAVGEAGPVLVSRGDVPEHATAAIAIKLPVT